VYSGIGSTLASGSGGTLEPPPADDLVPPRAPPPVAERPVVPPLLDAGSVERVPLPEFDALLLLPPIEAVESLLGSSP
jgi:hypothetical protein